MAVSAKFARDRNALTGFVARPFAASTYFLECFDEGGDMRIVLTHHNQVIW